MDQRLDLDLSVHHPELEIEAEHREKQHWDLVVREDLERGKVLDHLLRRSMG